MDHALHTLPLQQEYKISGQGHSIQLCKSADYSGTMSPWQHMGWNFLIYLETIL